MTERGNGATAEAGPKQAAAAETDPLELKARLDRFGEILARGLDLAEAGMTLGLTMLGTVGAAAQNKIIERIFNPTAERAAAEPQPAPASPATASAAAPGAGPAASPGASEAASYGITNRLLLRPGGQVSISFSVNNDSPIAGKPVRLLAEAFSGERSGAVLPPASLVVRPDEQIIAPMDFEKFVLEGTIPADVVPDRYRGSVVVLGEGPMRIPVLLVVEGAL
ncbi:MAG: hypothetical protein ACREF0_09550 [Acetobacteraceae bacterium]